MSVLLLSLMAAPTWATTPGEKSKIKGMIKERTAESLTISTREGDVSVVLDDNTRYKMPRGIGLFKDDMSATALIPGLHVSVEGVGDDQNRLVAKTISFSKDDLERAEAIQAGLALPSQQIAANQQNIAGNKENISTNQENIAGNKAAITANDADIEAANKRFNDLTDFEVKNQLTLNYNVGRAALTPDQKTQLIEIAKQASAADAKGYIIEVKGFADAQGAASMNQKLSMERALNVVAFLLQDAKVPQRRIVAPGAMGETNATASNETADGRADNRRVEVKVLVNRGLAAIKD
jgi:OOP family OmpA-OmpF porin